MKPLKEWLILISLSNRPTLPPAAHVTQLQLHQKTAHNNTVHTLFLRKGQTQALSRFILLQHRAAVSLYRPVRHTQEQNSWIVLP